MTTKKILRVFLLIVIFLSACQADTPVLTSPLVISEILTGIPGNNLHDYIELYNLGEEIVDLKGYSLWYQLKAEDEEILLYVWDQKTLVPSHGHYFLGQEGQEFEITPDAVFKQSLVPNRGILILKSGPEIIDKVAWGDVPALASEASPAAAMENGLSIERKPGGMDGNGFDSDKNLEDFLLNPAPSPQNTGSALTPSLDGELLFSVNAPREVTPGTDFEIILTLENQTGKNLKNIEAFFQVPGELEIRLLPEGVSYIDDRAVWQLPALAKGETAAVTLHFTSPWTFVDLLLANSYAQAQNWDFPSFNGPVFTSICCGSIPIKTARELLGKQVVVEGTATMYTGGFYAGSGAKFYLEDESGGAQVYVAGAGATLNVPIGAYVRVQGKVELYRGALEIIPASADDVEIISGPGSVPEWPPALVSIGQAANDTETLPGKLVQVEGMIARVEEFTYSYEVDMVNEIGQLVTLYVDKDTGISMEAIESGQYYRVLGIIEILDGRQRLYPRLQSDFIRIYPAILMIEANVPTTASLGEPFTISFTAYNHTPDPKSNLTISADFTDSGIQILSAEGGEVDRNIASWVIPELAGEGASTTVSLEVQVTTALEFVTITNYSVTADGWLEPAYGPETYTFIGDSVPIWAIQGSSFRSPYTLQIVKTEGVVTGVFPELDGFWLQETATDDNPATSAGIFVYGGVVPVDVKPGDYVVVSGQVREVYQQTQLHISGVAGLEVISSGYLLPKPVELFPPSEEEAARAYFESLEGMLVQVTAPALVVGPTNRYGEFAIILGDLGLDRVWQHLDTGMVIRVDDGSSRVHESQDTLFAPVATGDLVSDLVGPLAFTYSFYKIEPLQAFSVEPRFVALPTLPLLAEGEFGIMTWNVENLFDFLDPHPSSPSMPSVSEYKRDIAKVANTILAAGLPTVVGLQEVENIAILEDIAESEILAPYNYLPILIEGDDSRGIDVGYLVRGDQAEILNVIQYPAPEGITSRPPLFIHIRLTNGSEPIEVYILNNHFTSMSGGEAATEPRRNAQAAWNAAIVEEILAEEPDAYIAVIGDLNSYYDSLPIDTLLDAGLEHVFDLLPWEERYTYIYQGVSQTLDHILITPTLMDLILRVDVLHVNADYPLSLSDDTSPYHKSDHDPVVVVFAIP